MDILITGANRGIGAALSDQLSQQGHRIYPTSRTQDSRWPLEVTDPASHAALARTLKGQRLDAVICNAGIFEDQGASLDTGFPADIWAETFAANVTGVFLTIQSLLPNLSLSDAPKIMIIASQMGSSEQAHGGSYIYRASKAAAINLGRNLAVDLKPRGIALGIYHPGWVQTDMGGQQADISVDQAASGLAERLGDLTLHTTGQFLTWDGRPHPF